MRRFAHVSAAAALLAGASLPAFGQITGPTVLASTDPSSPLPPIYQFDVGSSSFSGTIPFAQKVTGMAYDQVTRTVYIFVRKSSSSTTSQLWTMTVSDSGAAVGPTLVGDVTGTPSNLTSGGLGWDPINNRLIASFQGRLFTVNTTAPVTVTQIRDFSTSANINSVDIDPVTGALYFTNNTTAAPAPVNNRGIYRIDAPIESGNVTKIADYPERTPGVPETDIDGFAVGGGILYMTTDETLSMYRLRLGDYTYLAPISQPFTGTGALVGGATFIGSAAAGADLGVAIRVDDRNSAPPNEITYVVSLRNLGSAVATQSDVSIPIPAGTSFVSATGGAMFSAGQVTLSAGDLGVGAAETTFSFTVANAANGIFTATVTGTTTAADVWNGNNTASATALRPSTTDLTVTLTGPASCGAAPGSFASYAATISNTGPNAVNDVVLTIPVPANATFGASVPPGSESMGVVTVPVGSISYGSSALVNFDLVPTMGATLSVTVSASGAAADTDPTDNSASHSFFIDNFINLTGNIHAVLSTFAGASNAAVPGMTGNLLAARATRSIGSGNAQWMVSHWQTDAGASADEAVVRTNLLTLTSSSAAQEGVTNLPVGFTPSFSFNLAAVNNSGDYCFSGRYVDGPNQIDYAAKSVNGTISMVGVEGQTAPAITGGTTFKGDLAMTVAGITNAGDVSLITNINGPAATMDEFVLSAGLTAVVAQENVTTPSGSPAVISDVFNNQYFTSADGGSFIYSGRVNGIGTNATDIAVYGTVSGATVVSTAVVVEGTTLPGMSSAVASIASVSMMPGGRWFVRGSNADNVDWVYSGTGTTGTVLLATGTPIIPGSAELWDSGAATSITLIANASNANGDYVIVGESTIADDRFDTVFVLNGTTIIARESDPVDTNNDGFFNDDAFLKALNFNDQIVVTNNAVYATVQLRDRANICSNGSTTSGYALARIPLPLPPTATCCRGSTCAQTTAAACVSPGPGIGATFVSGSTSCNATPTSTTPCCYADFNKTAGVTVQDIFDYLGAWFGGSPYARVHGDGTGGAPTVQSIFDFLAAWFSGGC